jgi:AraC-like DNA-binding protein
MKCWSIRRTCCASEHGRGVFQRRATAPDRSTAAPNFKLERAADFIRDHCTQMLKLEDICEAAQLSPSYLIRAFKQHYGMTPHAFLVNRRIQFARDQLRHGKLIADVALEFADQAHFQRAFKQHLAATPGQYRGEPRHRYSSTQQTCHSFSNQINRTRRQHQRHHPVKPAHARRVVEVAAQNVPA